MNAVSLNIPVAQTAPFQLGTSPETFALGGFTDVINLLLAGPAPDPPSGGSIALTEDPSLTGAPSLNVPPHATSDQIASALIRFMTKGKVVSASRKAASDQEIASILSAATGPSQSKFIPGGLNSVASIVAAAFQGATFASALPVGDDGISTMKSSVSASGVQGPIVKGQDVNGSGVSGGVKAGAFLKPSEPAPNFRAPVTFEMRLTPVTEPKLADSQTKIPSGSAAVQQNAPEAQPSAPVDSQTTVNPGSLAAQQSAPVTQSAHLPPLYGPAKPASGAIAAPVTLSRQSEPSAGESNTGSQAKPRQEQPAKTLGTGPMALGSDGPAPGNTFQAGFQDTAPAQTAPTGSAAQPKHIEITSTPLSAADTKDWSVKPQQQSQTHQIEVRISQPQEPPVDLQIAQRAGQIQVVVRTPDSGLESSLRQDLNTLVHSLERSGFYTETFVPVAGATAADSSRMDARRDPQQGQPDSSRGGSPGQNGGQNNGQNSGHNPGRGSGGNSRGDAFREQSEVWTNSGEEQS